LGVFLIWYSLSKLTASDIESIKNSFKTANYWWVLLSLFLGVLSHLSRSYRWKFLLEPMGYKPKLANSFMSVMMAYLLNLVIPRSGEVARAASLKKYENIPFEKAFGTIVAERVADLIMLLGIIGVAFYFQTDLIGGYIFKDNSSGTLFFKTLLIIGIPILGLLGYFLFKNSKIPVISKIIEFINGLIEGALSILTMKKKWAFIFHTIFIWLMYVFMFYTVTFALPETTNIPFSAIIVAFVAGSFAMVLTNGGLGSYPVFVTGAFSLYAISTSTGMAFGWIMWVAQTLMVLVLGGFSFIFIPIYNNYQKK
jgi:uncharacterized protein (TIRG00374 family)